MTGVGAALQVVPLDPKIHDRSAFASGAPELDAYLRDYAAQDVRRDVARVFVAIAPASRRVAGFYSLSAASFRKAALPAEQARRLPHYPVPAALLGRLAVDASQRGRGLGGHLLIDALVRIHAASRTLAVQAVIVDARDAEAAAFYRHYGFLAFVDDERRLFLPLATVRRLIGG